MAIRMKYVFLDGEKISSNSELHTAFHEALSFPDYCGKNLDALHDCITDIQGDICVIAVNTLLLSENIGRRWNSFLRLMNDLSKKKEGFRFIEEPFE